MIARAGHYKYPPSEIPAVGAGEGGREEFRSVAWMHPWLRACGVGLRSAGSQGVLRRVPEEQRKRCVTAVAQLRMWGDGGLHCKG